MLPFPPRTRPQDDSETAAAQASFASRATALTSLYTVPRALLAILALGAILRFAGINWDQGQHLHPDERFLTMVEDGLKWPQDHFVASYFDEAKSPLNPANLNNGQIYYVYGDFPIVLVKAVALVLHRSDYDHVQFVGRAVDGLVDVGTIFLIFLLGRTLYRDNRIGLLGALFYAMSALAVQQAHFFVVDNMTAFCTTLALFFLARVFQEGRFADYVFAGGAIGLALASKLSVYTIFLVLALVSLYRLKIAWSDSALSRAIILELAAVRFAVCVAVSLMAFRVFQPYAFQSLGLTGIALAPRWLANAITANSEVNGGRDAPFINQWAFRVPLLFPLKNMVLWGMGVPLGITVWVGWGAALWRLLRHGHWAHLIPVTWIAALFLFFGTRYIMYMRYFLPIYPTLALLGAWLCIAAWDRARAHDRDLVSWIERFIGWTPRKAGALIGIVVVVTFLYVVAFDSIHLGVHSRIAASRWIYANIPQGTVVANETSWDDALPLRVDGKDGFGGIYTGTNLEITDGDSPKKLDHVLQVLDQSQYIFISSNRQYDSLTRLPLRYPMVVNYYQALFSGQLGFAKVREFAAYPSLFGVSLPDQSAEESWTVYDHPRVQIFQKTSAYSHDRAAALLGNVDWNAIVDVPSSKARGAPKSLLLSPQDQALYRAGGTWHTMFQPDSLVNRFPVIFWALAVILFGLIGLPYLWVVAAPLPDRGYAFARPVGLLLVSWLIWWLASLRIVTFAAGGIWLSVVLCLVGGVSIAWFNRDQMRIWVAQNRTVLMAEEGLFWLFFLVVLLIRWANPDLWHPILGGEKPMDFAYLNATIKSTYFPPYDPWFAGGYINYYYFGFVLVATLVKLTGVVPYVAYNLAIPTFFAFLGIASFGAVLALTSPVTHETVQARRPMVFASLGALFVAVIGNLGELALIVRGIASLGSEGALTTLPVLGAFVRFLQGVFSLLTGRPLPFRIEWWYWNATRVIQHPPTEAGPINEMPWFTFLYADLHAHLMALPYTVVAVGLAIAFVRDTEGSRAQLGRVMRLGLLAVVLGALWPLNTWDFPTYALVALSAFVLFEWRRTGLGVRALIRAGVRWGVALVAGYLFFLPFHQHYGAAPSGVERWTGSQTDLADYVTIHGFFLFVITAALLLDFWFARDLNPVARLTRMHARYWRRWGVLARRCDRLVNTSPSYLVGVRLAQAGGLAALACVALRRGPTALVLVLMVLTCLLFFRRAPHRRALSAGCRVDPATSLWQMALIFVFAGLGLTLSVEYVVLKNVDIGRMNTVFKFYLQVWVLWGIAAAVAAASLYQRVPTLPKQLRNVIGGGFTFLFVATLLYPIFSTAAKIKDRFDISVGPTLNGMAFMDRAIFSDHDQRFPLVYDEEAMHWVQEKIPGSPVFAEVNTAPTLYGWGNRFAMFTGNPDVIGWDWHQRQQRGVVADATIPKRIQDIQLAYGTTDPKLAYHVFTRYGTQYFVVGLLERVYFPEGQNKWDSENGKLWNLVYENPGTRIYQIIGPNGQPAPASAGAGLLPIAPSNQPPVAPIRGAASQPSAPVAAAPAPAPAPAPRAAPPAAPPKSAVVQGDASALAAQWQVDLSTTVAQDSKPSGVALDSGGNVYVGDAGRHQVTKLDSNGAVLWKAQEASGDVTLRDISAVAIAADNTLLVLDAEDGSIYRFTPDGKFVAKISGDALGVYHPRGMAIGADGDIYLANTGGSRIVRLDPNGQPKASYGTKGNGRGELIEPTGVGVTASGDVLALDATQGKIVRYTASGAVANEWKFSTNDTVLGPQLSVDANGTIFATDTRNGHLLRFTPDGKLAGTYVGPDGLVDPSGVVAGKGYVIVTQPGPKRVVRLNTEG